MRPSAICLRRARYWGIRINAALSVIMLGAWCRSYVVSEGYESTRQFATWPNGIAMEVPCHSDKPRQWSVEGYPPVVSTRWWCITSGYGKFSFALGKGNSVYPTIRYLGSINAPNSAPFAPASYYYSKRINPWTAFWRPTEQINSLAPPLTANFHLLGLSYCRSIQRSLGGLYDGMSIDVPYWFLCGLSAIPLIVTLRRRKPREGRCPHCNYDLRATKDRCPECGHPIPAAAPDTAPPAAPN